ncbi:MAG: prepilin-type N-terminal cleavage/methylation domain-containing protein [Methylobacteriaceae bacterium]|nr:prepilin-type N-terminal cleavage/methylation domain-containing protein [Methylobacteriaceae bacterium]
MSQSAAPDAPRRNEGFTLIEVLVALVVVTISISALSQLMASNRRVAGALDTHLSLVETARGIETALPDRAMLAGNSAGESGDYRWAVFTRPFESNLVDRSLPTPWIPQFVAIRVQSPQGVSVQVNTIRLQARPKQ